MLLLVLASCGRTPPVVGPTATPPATATAAPSPTPRPTASASPQPSPTPSPTATPEAAPTDLYLTVDDVVLYPGPELYSGDLVTIDVDPRNLGSIEPRALSVRVYRQSIDPTHVIAEGGVGYPTFDGVPRARLAWAWDTTGEQGQQTLIAWLDPDDRVQEGDEDPTNNLVTLTVRILPRAELPPLEAATSWDAEATSCCFLHYLTGTSAERDLSVITTTAAEAVAQVEEQLGLTLTEPLDVYLLGRVIGHGGYAYEALALSYLDRHYAGYDLAVVVRHEATHVLDGQFVAAYPPALLREGLATWIGGGHFKPEPIPERAAALLTLDYYISLEPLTDDFYRQQHEVGYLEGAAFVDFLVDTFGWERFRLFYGGFSAETVSESDRLDAVLQEHFQLDLAEAERSFLAWLEDHPPGEAQVRDLYDTVYLFDTIRRYQEALDPSAYWLSGWLPNPTEGSRRGIEADFLRHPRAPENIALETMLIAARENLRAERYEEGEALINAVNRVLDEGDLGDGLAADYLAIVEAVAAAGYEAQQVDMGGDAARVWAIADWPILEELVLRRTEAGWAVD